MKAKFLYADMKGHAMAGEILEEIELKSRDNDPYLIVKITMCESRLDVNLIGKKLVVAKNRCEIGEFDYV